VALVREKETEDVTTEKTETAKTAETMILYLIEVGHQGTQIKKKLKAVQLSQPETVG
jgi:hypothetical protein